MARLEGEKKGKESPVQTFEETLKKCRKKFEGDRQAVASCVAGERIAYQEVEIWDKLVGIRKKLDKIYHKLPPYR